MAWLPKPKVAGSRPVVRFTDMDGRVGAGSLCVSAPRVVGTMFSIFNAVLLFAPDVGGRGNNPDEGSGVITIVEMLLWFR